MSADPTPAEQPTEQPTAQPTGEPAEQPIGEPAEQPTVEPTAQPAETSQPAALAAEAHVADGPTPADDGDRSREPLVREPFGFQSRWDAIQAAFVDEPRRSVTEADALVAEVIDEITDAFAGARAALEEQWSQGGEASTEDLRQAFQRYRSFFQRLLSA
jgi:outer membrane biosynthesis protein TonB